MNELPIEIIEFLNNLVSKADNVNAKTEAHKNVELSIDGLTVPIRVDDTQLLYIGAALLPNILNYLVNILPQFIYPYVVAYLQDLSSFREDPFTISELYSFLCDLKNGNILDGSETENQKVGI